jgi:hypothetical protein
MTHRKDAFTRIYSKLVDVQNSYRGISKQLSQTIHTMIPKNTEEVYQITALENQVNISERNIDRIEDLKFYCAISMLTEGALIDDNEITIAILLVEELIETARSEASSEDSYIKDWAADKMTIFENVRLGLLSIMTHKVDRKKDLGEINIQ